MAVSRCASVSCSSRASFVRSSTRAASTLALARRARSMATPTWDAIVDSRSSSLVVSFRHAGAATFMMPSGWPPK